MNLAIESQGGKSMVASGRITRRFSRTTVFSGSLQPIVMTIDPEIRPECVVITGAARVVDHVAYSGDGLGAEASIRATESPSWDLYITREQALRLAGDLLRAVDGAALTDPAQIALEVGR